jgi:hypothetical protein
MKELLLIPTLMAFVVAVPLAMAKEPAKINCCIKGKCEQMTKTDCKKEKGTVVKNCERQCKPPKEKPAKKY